MLCVLNKGKVDSSEHFFEFLFFEVLADSSQGDEGLEFNHIRIIWGPKVKDNFCEFVHVWLVLDREGKYGKIRFINFV